MAGIDKKNKSRDKKPFDKKPLDKKSKDTKSTKGDKTEKSPFEAQNDKFKEAIMALGGTKGDVKYLENVDAEDSENLVTGADEKAEVIHIKLFFVKEKKF
jgi:hypothetical protein